MVAITVGVACYNAEAWIEECVESLFGQTFADFEIVAVDDGSTDRTGELLDGLAARDGRLRVLHQENMGLGLVKNRILRVAKGAYLTFVDADDWLAPECLEETHRRAAEENLDIVSFGWVRVEDGSGRILGKRHDHEGRDTSDVDRMRKDAFSADINPMSCASLTRIGLFLDNGLVYPACSHEDVYVTPFLYFYGERFGYIDKDFYYWRVRRGSITQTISMAHIDGFAGAFGSWKIRLIMEGRFQDFRGAAIAGSFAYLSQARCRIGEMGRNDAELLRHFREQVLSIPELKEYRKHLSPKELEYRANVIEVIRNDDESRMAVESPMDTSRFPRLRSTNEILRAESGDSPGNIWHRSLRSKRSIIYDVAFAPHKDYHVVMAFPIAEILRRWGLRVVFLDSTRIRGDEGSLKAIEELGEKHCHDLADFVAYGDGFELLVVYNDWDLLTTRPLVQDAREAGAATVGFVEGINDFADIDVGFQRDAYRSAEWVLGAGENDRRYFRDMGGKFRVAGFPRIKEALKRPIRAPLRRQAVINVNFSYGVLEDKRDAWIASAIEGCRLAGLDWIISQHPQDRGDLSAYPLDTRDFESTMQENAILISRFSSCIIEALAMGRPVVYHNPDTEKVEKFREPLGAYSISFDAPSLARALESELERPGSVEKRRTEFLKEHCNCYHNDDLYEFAARNLLEILEEHRRKRLIAKLVQPFDVAGEHVGSPGDSEDDPDSTVGSPDDSEDDSDSTRSDDRTPISASGGIVRTPKERRWRVAGRKALSVFRKMVRTAFTPVMLFSGLALVGAGIVDAARSAWFSGSGLALFGLVIMFEAIVWRRRNGRLLAAVQAERERSGQALATERSRRSLVDVHLADRGLPLRRLLLLFAIRRSGSTWLFDLLRTHPAVRLEPTVRIWTRLGMKGGRYPDAFHHAEGASLPLEIAPGFGAAIPAFPRADVPSIDDAECWALEKAHPEFVGFAANGLVARIRNLRESGVEVEVVYCVRNPIDSMWSMAELKARNPNWYRALPVEQVPRHIAKSLGVLVDLNDLIGGSVIEYEALPHGMAMKRLGRMLDPSWGDAEVEAWLSHAASVTDRSNRRQGPGAGFFGERDRTRSPDGPDQAWLACEADVETANAAHRRLVADRK